VAVGNGVGDKVGIDVAVALGADVAVEGISVAVDMRGGVKVGVAIGLIMVGKTCPGVAVGVNVGIEGTSVGVEVEAGVGLEVAVSVAVDVGKGVAVEETAGVGVGNGVEEGTGVAVDSEGVAWSKTTSVMVPDNMFTSISASTSGTLTMYRPGATGANSATSGPYSNLVPVRFVLLQFQNRLAITTEVGGWSVTHTRTTLIQLFKGTTRSTLPVQTGAAVGVAVGMNVGKDVAVGGAVGTGVGKGNVLS
jgi:hypothetical protein